MVRALTPARSMAASSTSAFMTVASMPIASAVGRDSPSSEICAPRKTLPPPTTTPSPMPSSCAAIEIGGKAVDGRLMDAEFLRAAQSLAGELDDHPSVFRLRHGMSARDVAKLRSPIPAATG